ncbi:amino acid aminotransferase [Mariniblastus fucicola]|uniref:Aspartate aminotransferase n=1 Tax=Mariniblastus fucicola TaxID=980251 RepID=A0A5B9PB39_9BACT|nr:amino acid aminotransferase [Mariniblastus fucicola]QEG21736.1 Aspartate aminotransferase [Mariniblastus fucicola]
MFESAELHPPDAIFGLTEKFRNDPNENKISLTVGVYKDESGKTPLMQAVADAENMLAQAHASRTYLPIDGMPAYNAHVGKLLLGPVAESVKWKSTQTPGGTGALRVTGELLRTALGIDTIWISNPTWANHPKIFGNAGIQVQQHDYLGEDGVSLDFDAMMKSIADSTRSGQAILLHGACHNPTGVDPTKEQWTELLKLVSEKGLLPVFDFAYQGFGDGLDEDAAAIREFLADGDKEAIICNSFSKNFGLYGERTGGLTVVSTSDDASDAMQSQVKTLIRRMYSNPPTHGAAIVNTVLSDATLRKSWETELDEMRTRIKQLRTAFVDTMKQVAPQRDFSFLNDQRGMFSYSGLSGKYAEALMKEHSVYILGSGRINVAGINDSNRQRLCEAIASVL